MPPRLRAAWLVPLDLIPFTDSSERKPVCFEQHGDNSVIKKEAEGHIRSTHRNQRLDRI